MPRAFLALYRGDTVATAELIALSADPDLVRRFADELLEDDFPAPTDPVAEATAEGRRRALQIVRDEAEEEGE